MDDSQFQAKLAGYRELSQEKSELASRIRNLKSELRNYVKEHGDHSDDHGWAKEVEVSGQVTCKDPARLMEQAEVWAESRDPAISTLGKTVMTFLTLTPDTTHFHIQ